MRGGVRLLLLITHCCCCCYCTTSASSAAVTLPPSQLLSPRNPSFPRSDQHEKMSEQLEYLLSGPPPPDHTPIDDEFGGDDTTDVVKERERVVAVPKSCWNEQQLPPTPTQTTQRQLF